MAYTKRHARAYTRTSKVRKKSYIKTIPNSKIVKFKMGDLKGFEKGKYNVVLHVSSKDKIQLRDVSIEAVRQYLNRWLVDKDGRVGIGSSAKMQLPIFIQQKIEEGLELGPLVKNLMNDTEGKIRGYDGTNGILSKGLYNRVDEFKDAAKCALARFQSPELFKNRVKHNNGI